MVSRYFSLLDYCYEQSILQSNDGMNSYINIMTICVLKIKYIMYKVQDYGSVLFTSALLTQLYMRVDI